MPKYSRSHVFWFSLSVTCLCWFIIILVFTLSWLVWMGLQSIGWETHGSAIIILIVFYLSFAYFHRHAKRDNERGELP